MSRLLFALIFALLALPCKALAETTGGGIGQPFTQSEDWKIGRTLALVDGQERWLNADDLTGYPGWVVELKAFSGAKLEAETELSTVKGYTGTLANTRTNGIVRPDGSFEPRQHLTTFACIEYPAANGGLVRLNSDQNAGPMHLHEPLEWLPIVADKLQKFNFAGLDVSLYSKHADRFELTIYRYDFPGYVLDTSQPRTPVATLRAPYEKSLVGSFSGVLQPTYAEVYRVPPPRPKHVELGTDAQGNTYGTFE